MRIDVTIDDDVRASAGQFDALESALATTAERRHPHGLPSDEQVRAIVVGQASQLIRARDPGAVALRVYNPGDRGGTVVALVVDDAPFLMSSVSAELARLDLSDVGHAYPEFGVVRDDTGAVGRLGPARGAAERQTWIHVELAERLDEPRRQQVATRLGAVVGDVQRATSDFAAMRAWTARLADALDDNTATAEHAAFVRWLRDDHFVLLGARDYHVDGERAEPTSDNGLGLLRDDGDNDGDDRDRDDDVEHGMIDPGVVPVDTPALAVALTRQRSTVHRDERMVDVTARVRLHGDDRLCRLVGLFAKKATSEPVMTIPLLRRWIEQVIAAEDIVAHSHDERMLRSALEALPKDALFTADAAALSDVFDALVRDEPDAVHVVAWTHEPSSAAVVVVALPRTRFDAQARRIIAALVARHLDTERVEPFVGFHERDVLLTYVLPADRPLDREALDALSERLCVDVSAACRTWAEHVFEAAATPGAERAVERWVERFPSSYRDTTDPHVAVGDCCQLDALEALDDATTDARMQVVSTPSADSGPTPLPALRFKLFRRGPAVELSQFVPILESLGAVVVESVPHVLRPAADADAHDRTDEPVRIYVYGIRLRTEGDFDVDTDGARMASAAQAVWSGAADADSLNRLVLLGGLDWRDVVVLRAYRQFRRQVGTTFTASYQSEALCGHPEIARGLVAYFAARFDPDDIGHDQASGSEAVGHDQAAGSEAVGHDQAAGSEAVGHERAGADAARERLLTELESVSRLDQDRILRGYLALIDATVRTNRYRTPTRPYLTLKFDSSRIPDLPRPVPYREIFVYSPAMEGIHLRGGPVARGGLRWSDRREDFRTEVLDLMKAQMVKNALIVPTGSKGGFVLTRAVADDDVRDEVAAQYETFIRGMLDVTDTIVDGRTTHPDDVRCHDGDDSYLVVAADRGTAALSDVANRISKEYGYWLGDAFASGGSSGYDHKAMGITARGAWVAVRQHFRELDIDVQTEPITVVGIGDMSGDVFGNGMLSSTAIRLVAAFDHRDIFVDPDPDPERAHAERARLFAMARSTWQDYDRDLVSAGGGVWSRSVKRIALSEPMRALVRTDQEHMTPPALISALLLAPVDLLFAGGVGTFVKASSEDDADVGDRANDAIRVNGDELGARVVGEGGNLSVTQRGRIQYARRGGRINLDATDNAGGVDTSDREVNLKILLAHAIGEGRLERADRDDELAAVTDDVAEKVLDDVRAHTRLLSREATHSPADMDNYEQLMVDLEGAGRLDRDVEALPASEEVARREQAGGGLTRPELGLLAGYSKADLAARLTDAALTTHPSLHELLHDYVPQRIATRYGDLLPQHRLSDELIATLLANDLINSLGITVVSRTVHQLGCGAVQVALAYWVARQVSGAAGDWADIAALDDVLTPALQMRVKEPVDQLVEMYLRIYAARRIPDDVDALIARDRDAFVELSDTWRSDPPAAVRARRRELVAELVRAGVDEDRGRRLVARPDLVFVPDIAAVAADRERPIQQVADAFAAIGHQLPLAHLADTISRTTPDGHWEQWERTTLLDEVHAVRRQAARQALDKHPETDGASAVDRLLDDRTPALERVWSMVAMVGDDDEPGLAQMSVMMSALRAVLG